MKRLKGFTLIELLVVIAIIALLAAILFPVFARARDNARKSTCQNNLKQLGLSVQQYMQDFDEKFPNTPYNWNATDPQVPKTALRPYTKNEQLWVCPSDSNWARANGGISYSSMMDNWFNEHFFTHNGDDGAANTDCDRRAALVIAGAGTDGGGCGQSDPWDGVSLATVPRPASKPLFWDQNCWHQGQGTTSGSPNCGTVGQRNLVFIDGHVKHLPATQYAPTPTTGINERMR